MSRSSLRVSRQRGKRSRGRRALPRTRGLRRLHLESLEDRHLLAAVFDWEMAPRFGLDRNNDGRIDIPNTREYIHPDAFEVRFDAGRSQLDGPDGVIPPDRYRYEFEIDGPCTDSPVQSGEQASPEFVAQLGQGFCTVALTVSDSADDSVSETFQDVIRVRDLLIVGIGDSYGAGEGAPEVHRRGDEPALWADGFWPDDPATAERDREHRISHRSSLAAAAQMALRLEQADPHTSVTFVFVAASGAEIFPGALEPYAGIDNEPGHDKDNPMKPQLDQIAELVSGRTIDALVMSLGGNDAGFVRAIMAPLMTDFAGGDPQTVATQQQRLQAAFNSGDSADWEAFADTLPFPLSVAIPTKSIAGLSGLRDGYTQINERLTKDHDQRPRNIYISEYPDPTRQVLRDADGNPLRDETGHFLFETCQEALGEVIPPLSELAEPASRPIRWLLQRLSDHLGDPQFVIDQSELDFVRGAIIHPLNATVQAVAEDLEWTFVSGISHAFTAHGLCSPSAFVQDPDGTWRLRDDLQDVRDGITYIRTPDESVAMQGPSFAALTPLPRESLIHGHLARGVLNWLLGQIPEVYERVETKGTAHPNEFGFEAVMRQLYAHAALDLFEGRVPGSFQPDAFPFYHEYTFDAQAGDVVNLQLSAEGFDPAIALFGGEQAPRLVDAGTAGPLFYSQDTRSETGELISTDPETLVMVVEQSGRFTVTVQANPDAADPIQAGDYLLQLDVTSYKGAARDVIEVALPDALWPGFQFELLDPDPGEQPKGQVFPADDFAQSGRLYFAPSLDDDVPGDVNPDLPGFQGTFTGRYQVNGQVKTFTVVVGDDEPMAALQPHPVSGDGASLLDRLRIQQRLKHLGYPGPDGQPLVVTGQWNDASRHAVGLFNAVVVDGQGQSRQLQESERLADVDAVNWLNALDAPRWMELADGDGYILRDDLGELPEERWAGSWLAGLLHATGQLWLERRGDDEPLLHVVQASPVGGGPASDPLLGQAGMELVLDVSTLNATTVQQQVRSLLDVTHSAALPVRVERIFASNAPLAQAFDRVEFRPDHEDRLYVLASVAGMVTVAQQEKLAEGLEAMAAWLARVQSGDSPPPGFETLWADLPVLNAPLGELIDLSGQFTTSVVEPLKEFFGAERPIHVEDLAQQLSQLSFETVGPTERHVVEVALLGVTSDDAQLSFELTVDAAHARRGQLEDWRETVNGVRLDFRGAAAETVTRTHLHFEFGLDAASATVPDEPFFVRIASPLDFELRIDDSDLNFRVPVRGLQVELAETRLTVVDVRGGSLKLDVDAFVTPPPGRLDVAQLTDPLPIDVQVSVQPPREATLDVLLPLESALLNVDGPQLSIESTNVFDPSQTLTTAIAAEFLFDLSQLSPRSLLSALQMGLQWVEQGFAWWHDQCDPTGIGVIETAITEGVLCDKPVDGLVELFHSTLEMLHDSAAPGFHTIEELAVLLPFVVDVQYDLETKELEFLLEFNEDHEVFSLPLSLARQFGRLADLNIEPTQLTGTGAISAQMTIGFDLSVTSSELTALDRMYFRDTRLESTLTLSAADVRAEARIGPLGIQIGGAPNTPDASIEAEVGLHIELDEGNRVTLHELFDWPSGQNLVSGKTFGSATLDVPVRVLEDFLGSAHPEDPRFEVLWPDLKDLGSLQFIPNDDMQLLLDWEHMTFQVIIARLRDVQEFLHDRVERPDEAGWFLNHELPLVDKSVNDIVSVSEEFGRLVDLFEESGPRTIQEVRTTIEELFQAMEDLPL